MTRVMVLASCIQVSTSAGATCTPRGTPDAVQSTPWPNAHPALLKLAPNAGLLFFAIIFFGLMIDVGLFDPLIRLILRFAGHDPLKLVVGTALLTSVVSLDGDGSTAFIIVTSAFLPIYLRLG